MTTVPFVFVDVFAREPLTGNPLALVPDADGLSEERMRSIAREFNQSETTFLVRPTLPGALWRLRSFTAAGHEVLGAGHNAMGAWIWLADSGRLSEEAEFVQQIGDDLLPVLLTRVAGAPSRITMQQSAPAFGAVTSDGASLADALALTVEDLAGAAPASALSAPGPVAQTVSTGVGHLLVPLVDRAAVDRAAPDAQLLAALLAELGAEGCYVYSLDPVAPELGSVAYTRFFNPTVGITEDPATGTAAGPLAAALVRAGRAPEGRGFIIEQGYVLGRPSLLELDVDGSIVRLSGAGLIVANGTLSI